MPTPTIGEKPFLPPIHPYPIKKIPICLRWQSHSPSVNPGYCGLKLLRPVGRLSLSIIKVGRREAWPLLGLGGGRNWNHNGLLVSRRRDKNKRAVLVKFNQGFGFNNGSDPDGKDDSANVRLLLNVAAAVGLTYLSFTGQLGWLLDAIVSIWLLAALLPIVGLGALLWWAGREIIQGSCPNCGKEFQIFRSSLNDELQLCPFCTQPFSVVDDEFVKDFVKFSNQSAKDRQVFNGFSPRSPKKGKQSSSTVVDVEAEITDAD